MLDRISNVKISFHKFIVCFDPFSSIIFLMDVDNIVSFLEDIFGYSLGPSKDISNYLQLFIAVMLE